MKSTRILFLLTFLFFACSTKFGNQELALTKEEQHAFDLAEAQLVAYNARDIDAFMAVYSDSITVYSFPNEPILHGHRDMRERYSMLFDNTPDLHCMLVKRIVQGNTVIDQELVTRKKGEPKSNAIAIYKIENGKISEVYFIVDLPT